MRDPISKNSNPFQTVKQIKKKTWQAVYELDESDFFENTEFIKKNYNNIDYLLLK